jgi:hypothetical protein
MKELPQYVNTAGKITILTAILGVALFAVVFLLNIGAKELQQVEAQGMATTTVTVLNTPPQWTVDAQELTPSSTTTPTNSSTLVTWSAKATDSNGESYYLLICSNGNAPTANNAAVPTCGSGATRWAVSSFTASGASSTAATTTTEVAPFAESNNWFAWVCDAVAVNPRCNSVAKQGTAPKASPFNVNKRPTFTMFRDNSPTLPGVTVTFFATSSDTDVVGAADTVRLIVCSSAAFSTSTDTCGALTLATSTLTASNPTATYVIPIPTQDQNYEARGFIVDNHGHEASGATQGSNSVLTVSNATPSASAAQITLNGGNDIALAVEAGQTTGFTLQFVASDNNSCDAVGGGLGDEITDYVLSVYRSGIGSTTCNGTAGAYNPNNCYTSGLATSTWNLSCTASTTSCTGSTDTTQIYNCTFPLWYIADPTDFASSSLYAAQDWRAAVSPIDNNSATGTFTQSSTAGIDVLAFLSMTLDTFAIPYGQLEPGQKTDPLSASTTILATGNVGIDERLTGESMCTTYTSAVNCRNSATSTIAESYQVFATSTVTYASATSSGHTLSSSTQKLLDINVRKSTTTSSQADGITFWGIHVPITLTLAGSYTGENTFYGVVSSPAQW